MDVTLVSALDKTADLVTGLVNWAPILIFLRLLYRIARALERRGAEQGAGTGDGRAG